LWPESIIAVGAMRKGPLIRAIEVLERFAYRNADLVVSVTDGFVPHIAARRGDKPVIVVKNGVDLTLFGDRDTNAADLFRKAHGLSGKFVAAYIGTHGMAHGLDIILEAGQRLVDRDDIRFLLVGDGAQRDALLAERDRRGLTNVIMLDQQPRASMPAIWGATNAALIILRQIDTFKTVLPSKMFEAMAIGCPIIMAVEGEARALMEVGNAGIAITPEAAGELAAAVVTLADDPARAADLGGNGQVFVRREFDRSRLAATMMDAFTKLAAR
jgi:glycosyltransferase involved in cell wall biosynthesis